MEHNQNQNQNLKQKLTTLIYKAETLDDLDYLQAKIEKTAKINRRTKQGRELTQELLTIINIRARELIDLGELPF